MDDGAKTISSTGLILLDKRETANDRLLFGRPQSRVRVNISTVMLSFCSDQTFGFVRWRGDEYGTQTWRVAVAQAGGPGEPLTRIPGVKPGAHLLLHTFGKSRAKRALRAIDLLSDKQVLHNVHPDYWRHIHLQISKNLPIDPYDIDAFAALGRAKQVE